MTRELPSDWSSRAKAVYARDDYKCQNCGRRGGDYGNAELHAHHGVPRKKGGSHEISNLTTYCKQCHNSIHHNNKLAPTIAEDLDDKTPTGLKELMRIVRSFSDLAGSVDELMEEIDSIYTKLTRRIIESDAVRESLTSDFRRKVNAQREQIAKAREMLREYKKIPMANAERENFRDESHENMAELIDVIEKILDYFEEHVGDGSVDSKIVDLLNDDTQLEHYLQDREACLDRFGTIASKYSFINQ